MVSRWTLGTLSEAAVSVGLRVSTHHSQASGLHPGLKGDPSAGHLGEQPAGKQGMRGGDWADGERKYYPAFNTYHVTALSWAPYPILSSQQLFQET